MPTNRGRSRRESRWSMYPNLHDQVTDLLEEDGLSFNFQNIDDDNSCTHTYDTHIMGRFDCHNSECSSTGWSSKKIPITIRMYPRSRYNARVYHQRCQQCNALGRPLLDEDSYVERVAYRLKRWMGVEVERPMFSPMQGPPHQSDLCEGCKAGHCVEGLAGISYRLARLGI